MLPFPVCQCVRFWCESVCCQNLSVHRMHSCKPFFCCVKVLVLVWAFRHLGYSLMLYFNTLYVWMNSVCAVWFNVMFNLQTCQSRGTSHKMNKLLVEQCSFGDCSASQPERPYHCIVLVSVPVLKQLQPFQAPLTRTDWQLSPLNCCISPEGPLTLKNRRTQEQPCVVFPIELPECDISPKSTSRQ